MLDVYIIERIRQQREESRRSGRLPLRIEIPVDRPEEHPERRQKDEDERGVAIIDFTV